LVNIFSNWIKIIGFFKVNFIKKGITKGFLISLNTKDFLLRLTYLHDDRIKYLQIDNGSEWERHFVQEVEKRRITLVYNLFERFDAPPGDKIKIIWA